MKTAKQIFLILILVLILPMLLSTMSTCENPTSSESKYMVRESKDIGIWLLSTGHMKSAGEYRLILEFKATQFNEPGDAFATVYFYTLPKYSETGKVEILEIITEKIGVNRFSATGEYIFNMH